MYCVTLMRVCLTILAREELQIYILSVCVCVCSLSYPACNAHAPYFNLRPVRLYDTFSSSSHERNDFRRTVIEQNIYVFLYNFCLKHSKKNWARCCHKCVCVYIYIWSHVNYQLFFSDFHETWTFSTNFRKILKYQTSWKSVQWKQSCSMRTDGQIWRRQ